MTEQLRDDAVLTVNALTKRYGSLTALDSASFVAHRGEVLGLLGPNGAGKTTAMKIVTGYMVADSGAVYFRTGNGSQAEVHQSPLSCRSLVGWMPENVPVYEDMDADQFLLFTAEVRGIKRSQALPRINQIADEIGLLPMLRRPVRELSRGYRQRVGLAQALLHDPPILILDEPTSGLDPTQLVGLHEYLRDLARRQSKTLIFSSHILPEVEAVADRIVLLARGKVVHDGTCDDLRTKHGGGNLTDAFLKAVTTAKQPATGAVQ